MQGRLRRTLRGSSKCRQYNKVNRVLSLPWSARAVFVLSVHSIRSPPALPYSPTTNASQCARWFWVICMQVPMWLTIFTSTYHSTWPGTEYIPSLQRARTASWIPQGIYKTILRCVAWVIWPAPSLSLVYREERSDSQSARCSYITYFCFLARDHVASGLH